MAKEKENVCCIHLDIISCGDSDEHRHFACEGSRVLELDNVFIKKHCLGVDHNNCLLLRRRNNGTE